MFRLIFENSATKGAVFIWFRSVQNSKHAPKNIYTLKRISLEGITQSIHLNRSTVRYRGSKYAMKTSNKRKQQIYQYEMKTIR